MVDAIGTSYDNGGKTYINSVSQYNAAKAFDPASPFGRARTLWKYRLAFKDELTGTTPNSLPTNSALLFRTSIHLVLSIEHRLPESLSGDPA
jgi:hypothetical protein